MLRGTQEPCQGFKTGHQQVSKEETKISQETKVWPTGLTLGEAEELNRYLISGSRAFAFISACAHFLAYHLTPWLR